MAHKPAYTSPKNMYGMTFMEWIHAAGYGRYDSSTGELHKAWERGEDPSDYRAMAPRRRHPRSTGRASGHSSKPGWVWLKEYKSKEMAQIEMMRLRRVAPGLFRVRSPKAGIWLVEERIEDVSALPRLGRWESAEDAHRRKHGYAAGKHKPWIQHEGALGGPGYHSKSAVARHRLLAHSIRADGYTTTLRRLLVLTRNHHMHSAARRTINADIKWLKERRIAKSK